MQYFQVLNKNMAALGTFSLHFGWWCKRLYFADLKMFEVFWRELQEKKCFFARILYITSLVLIQLLSVQNEASVRRRIPKPRCRSRYAQYSPWSWEYFSLHRRSFTASLLAFVVLPYFLFRIYIITINCFTHYHASYKPEGRGFNSR